MAQSTFCECIEFFADLMCSPHIDMGVDPMLSVSVACVLVFLVLSDGICASPFHFTVPLTLKISDDDLIKVFLGVAWKSCSCGMAWNDLVHHESRLLH